MTKCVIDYKIVSNYHQEPFTKEVMFWLNRGYELYSSPNLGRNGYNGEHEYYQVVILYKNDEPLNFLESERSKL